MDKETDLKIEDVAVIVRMSDGSHRQVIAGKDTEDAILGLVWEMEGKIRVTDTVLHGIVIDKQPLPEHKNLTEQVKT